VSGATFFRDEARPPSPLWRFVSIVSLFLLLWPPICGSVFWWMKFDFGPPLLGWVALIVIYSYFFCTPAALLAGIIHAVAAVSFHHNSLWIPLSAAAGATVALIFVIAPGSAYDLINVPLESYAVVLIASLVASFTCWRLTRRFARAA